jgi:hypothetical protein
MDLRIQALKIDASNPDTVYAATRESGVFKTTAGGTWWDEVSNEGLSNPRVTALLIDSASGGLYAGTRGSSVFRNVSRATPLSDPTLVLKDSFVYPNPAGPGQNPVIRAMLGKVDRVEITIYDVAGNHVHSAALNGEPGEVVDTDDGPEYFYEYTWQGQKASGLYFAVISGHGPTGGVMARAKFAVVH